ncbi:MAG TPA: DNA cytosine methyltransferase [Blastocatellia bacterium]|nr:DNA cytosine methyltransferase [Blastocatellia bacterium]
MSDRKPLAIDLYCGLGGWTEGLLAEGYRVVGFDIERHEYGDHKYPAQLVIQDVLTLHGSQFKDAALIVASPPCQAYSYRAMPWKRAKELPPPDNTLFEACFRIQREACEAAGRHTPLVVENVRGAQPWVGRAAWRYGSFYLWGDIPALMPITLKAAKVPMPPGGDSLTIGFQQLAKLQAAEGLKTAGMNWSDRAKHGQDFTRVGGHQAIKNSGGSWFNIGSPGQKETNRNPVHELAGRKLGPSPGQRWEDRPPNVAAHREGTKNGGDWFNSKEPSAQRKHGSKSNARKAASAMIAKIPFVLAQHIARAWKPR